MANRRSIEEKIEKLKQMATLGLAESEQLLGEDRQHRWSIPDRKMALKYLLAVKQGMDPRQWAALHPVEWKRLVETKASHQVVTVVPMGFVVAKGGLLKLDPDVDVQDTVKAIFRASKTAGSIVGAVKWLRKQKHLRLVTRSRTGEIRPWKPNKSTVAHMLHNPLYKGRYEYGQTRLEPTLMLSDVAGARVVLSRLLEGKVIFHPELDTRAYTVRAVIALGRVIQLTSPTGFYTSAHPPIA